MSFRFDETPGPISNRLERSLFAWSLLVALLLLAGLAAPFFAGRVYLGHDLGDFHLPARAFYAEQLARHEAFDWMPSLFSGFYLTGEGQDGYYHPVHWLLFRFLPLRTALGWEYLCSYPFMLVGMWLFLRRRLRRWDAAMLGSVMFTFSSFNLLHFVHPGAVASVAHIPWMLAAIDVVMVDAHRIRVATAQAILALLTGSQILLGCPQFVWFSLIVESGFTVFLLVTRRFAARDGCATMPSCGQCVGCGRSSYSRVIIAKGLGLLLGAVQWLPILDSLIHGTWQTNDSGVAGLESLHPINLVQLVAPYLPVDRAFGADARELSLYVGAVPLMLVVWVFARRRELQSLRPLACVAGGLAAVALFLAICDFARLPWLRLILPEIGWFRYSCRYIVLFQFAVSVLASIGFVVLGREALRSQRQRDSVSEESAGNQLWKKFEALWAVVLISVAVALAGFILQERRFVAPWPYVLAGPLFLATAAILIIAAAQGVRGALVSLILFAAADLGFYGLSCTLSEPTGRPEGLLATIAAPPSDSDSVVGSTSLHEAAEPPDRVFAPSTDANRAARAIGNQMTLGGWRRVDGYAELEPRRQLNYYSLPALRVASTRWVRRTPATSAIPGLIARSDLWCEVPDPLPQVRLVARVVASDNPANDLARIDVQRAALCEYPLAFPPDSGGQATLVAQRPGWMQIDVRCKSPQLLSVAESFHSGWHCTVDGCPRPVCRVNGDFLGCPVESGQHQVELEFRPESLHRGWIASILGLGLVLCCFFGQFGRLRRGDDSRGET